MFIKYKIQIFFSVGGEITLLETLEGSQSCLPQRGHTSYKCLQPNLTFTLQYTKWTEEKGKLLIYNYAQ